MRNYNAKDVDGYISSSNIQSHPIQNQLRNIIKSTIPDVDERISWGVPFYRHNGLLAGFAVFKNHVSFGLVNALDSEDIEKLEKMGYKTGKKIIQIRFDQKIPTAMIKKFLKNRVKVNSSKKFKNNNILSKIKGLKKIK